MRHLEHGRILDVTTETLGSTLSDDTAAGATSLIVDDAGDFEDDGSGGWLQINDQVIQYGDVDDDTGTITLLTALTDAAEDGDVVAVWNDLYQQPDTVQHVLAMVDGADDNTDPVAATLADGLDELAEGTRGKAGETCTLEQSSVDDWQVIAVHGRPSTATGIKFYDLDTFTTTAAGAQSFTLTHTPIDGSVHMGWGGLWQPHTEFTVDGNIATVPDADGLLAVGDVIDFRYAYRDNISTPQVVAVNSETIVPIPGTVSVGLRPFGVNGPQPSKVGTGGIWNDASDATYAELYTYDNPDASAADSSSGNIQATAVGTSTAGATVYARIRWEHLNPTAPGARGPFVSLQNNLNAYYVTDYPTGAPIVSTPTTFDVPLPITAGDLGPVLERIEAGNLTVYVQAPYVYTSNAAFPGIRIYEVCLVVKRTS